MLSLPKKDPAMLVSAINFLLRDEICEDLDHVCNDYDLDKQQLLSFLRNHGFEYNEQQKKFW